jgi:hypothetical protein
VRTHSNGRLGAKSGLFLAYVSEVSVKFPFPERAIRFERKQPCKISHRFPILAASDLFHFCLVFFEQLAGFNSRPFPSPDRPIFTHANIKIQVPPKTRPLGVIKAWHSYNDRPRLKHNPRQSLHFRIA